MNPHPSPLPIGEGTYPHTLDGESKDFKNESQFTNLDSLNNNGLLRVAQNGGGKCMRHPEGGNQASSASVKLFTPRRIPCEECKGFFALLRMTERKELNALFPYCFNVLTKKAAFTLAEVLITLGIIGVVAAMTIPGLINKYSKTVIETQLKENYSIVQQAMKLSEYEEVTLDSIIRNDSLNSMKEWFNTFFLPNLKTSQVCYDTAGCWHTMGSTKNLANQTAYYNRDNIGVGADIIVFKLYNGSNMLIDSYSKSSISSYFGVDIPDNEGLILMIDANGDKKPNIIGKDIYALVYSSDGLVAAGSSRTAEQVRANCSATASGSTAGYYCMQRVKNNGWTIPKDVWNKKI